MRVVEAEANRRLEAGIGWVVMVAGGGFAGAVGSGVGCGRRLGSGRRRGGETGFGWGAVEVGGLGGVGVEGVRGVRDVGGIDIGVGVGAGVGVGVGLARVGRMVRVVGIVVVADSVVVVGRSSCFEAWRVLVAGIGEEAGRVGAVVGKLVEDRSAEGVGEEDTWLSVVTAVTAEARRVVELQVILEARRSCVAVAAPGMAVVGLRFVLEDHYLVRTVLYLYLHVRIDLLFRDPLSLDRDRFRLCRRANSDVPQLGRSVLLSESLPDPSFHADLVV